MKRNLPIVLLLPVLLLGAFSCAPKGPSKQGGLAVGDDAYDFNLPESNGNKVRLSDRHPGWYLMLVFYRGSWCDACLNQLLDLKRDMDKFSEKKTALAAISVDSTAALADFNASWRFPFPLLSDRYLEVIDAYGARHPNGHEGKDISKPLIVIVGPDGKIVFKYLGHSPVDRPSNVEMLDWLKNHALKNPAS